MSGTPEPDAAPTVGPNPAGVSGAARPVGRGTTGRGELLAAQKQRYGGIKWGSAFFGWLTATGTALLLTALAAVVGAVSLANIPGSAERVGDQVGQAAQNPATAETAGLVGAVVPLVILFLAYYCGGYVAGRMARFNGARQGVGVWLWAVIIAVVVAVLGLIAGTQFNLLANLNTFPRIPVNEGTLTTAGVLTAVAVAIVALVGAILGGVTGMRFHRRVDKEGLGR